MDDDILVSDTVQRNTEDINLAYKTLVFLGELDAHLVASVDVRSLLVNLCNYQTRFATPMELPFGMGMDMPNKLETPRPISVLIKYNAVVETDLGGDVDEEATGDFLHHEGKTYCLVGSNAWKRNVGSGDGEDSDPPPRLSSFLWIPDLLELLAKCCKAFPNARRLAACWYYTATECTFEEDDDGREVEEEAEKLPSSIEEFLGAQTEVEEVTGVGYLNTDMEDYSSDEDDDFVPDEEDEDDEEFSSSEEDSDEPPELEPIAGEDDGDEPPGLEPIADERMDTEEMPHNDGGNDEPVEEETEFARGVRERVLNYIGQMHAYVPSPTSEAAFFKRTLRKISQGRADERWFPWGSPPLSHIVGVTAEQQKLEENDEEDEALLAFLREILTPFADASPPSS